MSRLGAVVGLSIERTILRWRSSAFDQPPESWIEVAGANAARAEALAQALLSRGANALISIGIAGGLDPDCRPGVVVVATAVTEPGGLSIPTHDDWRTRVAAALNTRDVRVAPIAGIDFMATSPHQKADLFRKTSAAAVDMESHGVARAAARQSVPFLALRVIADPASRALPASVAAGLGSDGAVQPLATAAAVLAHPGEIGALLSVTANTATALYNLWQAVRLAGPALRSP